MKKRRETSQLEWLFIYLFFLYCFFNLDELERIVKIFIH